MLSKAWKKQFGPKTKLFEHTERGKQLARVAEEGVYSPEMKRSMIGESTAQNQAIAQKRRVASKGRLISSGFGGSIAGNRLLAAPGVQAQRNVSDYAGDISRENMLSRVGAGEALATGKDESRSMREAERQKTRAGFYKVGGMALGTLIPGVGNVLGASIGGRLGGMAAGEGLDTSGLASDIYADRLSKYRTSTEEARKAYYEREDKEPVNKTVPDDLTGYSNIDLVNLSEVSGVPIEELRAATTRQKEAKLLSGNNQPAERFYPSMGYEGYDNSYGYGGR